MGFPKNVPATSVRHPSAAPALVLDPSELALQQAMLERIDADKDERLSFSEFLVLFEEEQRKAVVIKYARQKFNQFDVDHSGVLDAEEILQVVEWLVDISDISGISGVSGVAGVAGLAGGMGAAG
jgi:hypothetical protein